MPGPVSMFMFHVSQSDQQTLGVSQMMSANCVPWNSGSIPAGICQICREGGSERGQWTDCSSE